jgi:hypothetical protein
MGTEAVKLNPYFSLLLAIESICVSSVTAIRIQLADKTQSVVLFIHIRVAIGLNFGNTISELVSNNDKQKPPLRTARSPRR